MVSQRSPPPVETPSCAPLRSRTTSEQVASKEMPTISAASAPALASAPRIARADGPPDILGIVLGMTGLRPVHDDRVVGAAEQSAAAVENPGARAAGADIDGTDAALRRASRVGSAALPCQQVGQIAHVVEDEVGLHRLECRAAGRRARHASRRRRQRRACPLAWRRRCRPGCPRSTVQFSGATPISRATCRKRSGAGLPRATIEALKICGSNRSRRPVTSSDSRMRSSWLDEATQRLPSMRASASRIPGIGLRSLRKRSIDRRPHGVEMVVGDDQAEFVAQHAVDGRHAAAEEALIGGRLADLAADLGNQREQHVDRDRLAVDQHAVAIEDDQFRAILHQRATSPSGERWARAAVVRPGFMQLLPAMLSGQSVPER